MRLDAWLRQNRSLGERLRVVECLCQAVNAVHDRGEALAALEPSKIELATDGRCDLDAAQRGSPSREYLAPDRADGGQPSAIADVYTAGAIAWEILVGRTPGASPSHLAEVRPDVPREVADAVMACLERSPDWRPKDLTYLAQIAAAKQPAQKRAAPPPRASRPPRPARADDGRPARRTWPLLVALVVVLGLAAAAGWQYLGPGSGGGLVSALGALGASARPTPAPRATPVTTAPADAATVDSRPATRAPTAAPTSIPAAAPTPVPEGQQPGTDATPVPTPVPTTLAPTPFPVVRPAPQATTEPETSIPSVATDRGGDADLPPPAIPAELTAVSPLSVARPGKSLLDIRGTSLRPTHRVRIVPLKKAPSGISVVRQKLVSDTLITVLVDLAPDVSPGEYGLVVEEPQGPRSNTLIFTVSK